MTNYEMIGEIYFSDDEDGPLGSLGHKKGRISGEAVLINESIPVKLHVSVFPRPLTIAPWPVEVIEVQDDILTTAAPPRKSCKPKPTPSTNDKKRKRAGSSTRRKSAPKNRKSSAGKRSSGKKRSTKTVPAPASKKARKMKK